MTRWWLPLLALGWASAVSAQTPPSPSAPATIPYNAFGDPNTPVAAMPGPVPDPGITPPGAGLPGVPPVTLPASPEQGSEQPAADDGDHSGNAFVEPGPPSPHHGFWYAGVGFVGLQRLRLGHGEIAALDPGSKIPGFPPNTETGIPPPANAPLLLNFADISPVFNWGTKTTLGYHVDDSTFELTGYYLGLNTAAKSVSLPGQVDLPFGSFNAPLGFQGVVALWLQADFVEAVQETRVANAEFNYRHQFGDNIDLIAGFRYLDLQERFSIFTDDVGLVVPSIDPFGQATYSIATHNRIAAPQLGFALNEPVAPWLGFSFEAKGAWGANFVDEDHLLMRGDGFLGPSSHTSHITFSHVYDLELLTNMSFGDHIRIRAGYQALFVVDVPVASQQVDFDPNNPLGHRDYRGSIFFHGPTVEIQFAF